MKTIHFFFYYHMAKYNMSNKNEKKARIDVRTSKEKTHRNKNNKKKKKKKKKSIKQSSNRIRRI